MRPLVDSFEVASPTAAAMVVRGLARAPQGVRRRVLEDAFGRAERAFNRGDFAAVFALFADQVEYVPPPPLHDGPPIVGRAAVRDFWDDVAARFSESQITNLLIEEAAPTRFVRTAELVHRGHDAMLQYRIRQTTELHSGRVVRQVNELLD